MTRLGLRKVVQDEQAASPPQACCPQGHGMSYLGSASNPRASIVANYTTWSCDACGQDKDPLRFGRHHCHACEYDLCQRCFNMAARERPCEAKPVVVPPRTTKAPVLPPPRERLPVKAPATVPAHTHARPKLKPPRPQPKPVKVPEKVHKAPGKAPKAVQPSGKKRPPEAWWSEARQGATGVAAILGVFVGGC